MSVEALKSRILSHHGAFGRGEVAVATPVDGLHVVATCDTRTITHMVYDPVFCLVLQGAKEIWSGERRMVCGAMQSFVVSVDLPVVTRVIEASRAEPYIAVALRITPALVSEMTAVACPDQGHAMPCPSGFGTAGTDPAIVDAFARLVGLFDRPEAIPVIAPMIQREIHYWLMTSDHALRLWRSVQVDGHGHQIARTVARLRGGFQEPLRVETLAHDAGMSVSAFHEHFRAVTGTTPIQFQKSLRLIEARRLLQAGQHSVATAAFDVGYESPTQFSREYARKFGNAPREDLRGGLQLAG